LVNSKFLSSKGSSGSGSSVIYTCQIDTAEYQSDKSSSTISRESSFRAREIIDRNPADSERKVYYNPKKPSEAVPDPGLQSDNYRMVTLSGLFFALVLYAFILQLNQKDNKVDLPV
jgi:hypothetical protein